MADGQDQSWLVKSAPGTGANGGQVSAPCGRRLWHPWEGLRGAWEGSCLPGPHKAELRRAGEPSPAGTRGGVGGTGLSEASEGPANHRRHHTQKGWLWSQEPRSKPQLPVTLPSDLTCDGSLDTLLSSSVNWGQSRSHPPAGLSL